MGWLERRRAAKVQEAEASAREALRNHAHDDIFNPPDAHVVYGAIIVHDKVVVVYLNNNPDKSMSWRVRTINPDMDTYRDEDVDIEVAAYMLFQDIGLNMLKNTKEVVLQNQKKFPAEAMNLSTQGFRLASGLMAQFANVMNAKR